MAQRAGGDVAAPLDLERVLTRAMVGSPGATLSGLFYGTGARPILTVYLARPSRRLHPDGLSLLDQAPGEPLYTWRRGANQSLGDRALWLLAPLHFGTSWGLAVKVLWAFAGLAFPSLAVTGLLMYWNRWLAKRLRPSRAR